MYRLLLLLALIVMPTGGTLAAPDLRIVKQVRDELRSELQAVDSILPGHDPAEPPLPRFAVAEFRVSDDALVPVSQALAVVLRWKIQYVPDVRLQMPSFYYTAIDAGAAAGSGAPLMASDEHFRALRLSSGTQSVLTGSLERIDGGLVLDAELVDTASGQSIAANRWQLPDGRLSEPLIEISEWVYARLGVELAPAEREFLTAPAGFSSAAIAAFIENYEPIYTLERVPRRELLAGLRSRFPEYSLFAGYALHAMPVALNQEAAFENLETSKAILARFPAHSGVRLESFRVVNIGTLPEHEVANHIRGLRALVLANPDDPMIVINFANALGEDGNTLDAIAVMSEAVTRWSDHYRVWWSYAWLLNSHAWQVRGNKYWKEVPKLAQNRFKRMSHLSDRAVDRSLELHSKNGGVWVLKLKSVGSRDGYSDELMRVFEEAAAVAPHEENVYGVALNYSLPQWGGKASSRRRIIRLAEENNPDAAWPEIMRAQHAGDFDELDLIAESIIEKLGIGKLLDHPDFWKLLFAVLGLIFIYYVIGARRAREENEDPFARYRSE